MKLEIQCPELTAISDLTQPATFVGGTIENSLNEFCAAGWVIAVRDENILSWTTEYGKFKFDSANVVKLYLGQAEHMGRVYPSFGVIFANLTEPSGYQFVVCQQERSEWLKENALRIAELWAKPLDDSGC